MTPRRRPAMRSEPFALLLAAALGLSSCSSSGDGVRASAPDPDAETGRICEALLDAVPDSVAGGERRETEPSSPYTTAWGDPAIVLRCGVEPPEEMKNPRAAGGRFRGVDWMLENPEGGRHRCTTTYRKAYVEVSIPEEYGDVQALVELADAVRKTVPKSV
ncbi:DUF3515 domain-containing protein [Streptomyces sp. P1-3]|uniref:DUF3515 domain-containing protein n=1 Tax=Streptomyces sp. P1-3 TaxID=3421658 RepID=UPI003D365781